MRRLSLGVIAAALVLVAGCGGDFPAPQSARVDVFALRSADLPDGYRRVPASSQSPACLRSRVRRQLKQLGGRRCTAAMFRHDLKQVHLFAYRFRNARDASAALPRVRRSAVRRSGVRSPRHRHRQRRGDTAQQRAQLGGLAAGRRSAARRAVNSPSARNFCAP